MSNQETSSSDERIQKLDNFNYAIGFFGGIAIIVGALLPWVSLNSGFFNTGFRDLSGIGFWGMGAGTIVFILGWLIVGGVFNFTFGIPRNNYLTILGLTAYSLMLAYIFLVGAGDIDFGIGTWVALGGAAFMIFIIGSTLANRRDLLFGSRAHFKKESLHFINALLAVGFGVGINWPYISEIDNADLGGFGAEAEPADRIFDMNIHFASLVVSLLVVLFIINIVGLTTKKNPPAALYLLFGLPLLALNSIFIFSTFLGDSVDAGVSRSGPGAGNWVIFTSALIIVGLSAHVVRKENAGKEA